MFWVLSWLLYLLLGVIGAVAIREMLIYRRTLRYKRQGFKWRYVPFLGQMTLFSPGKEEQEDGMASFKEVLATAKGSPGLVTNDAIGGSALIYLTDLELIKEFFVKEVSIAKRGDVGDLKVNFSFFFDNSEHGMTHRGVFAELFKLENIIDSIPIIHAVAKSQLAGLAGAEPISFDFRQKLEELVKEVARKVLFGDKSEVPRCPDEQNTMVTEMVFRILHEVGSNKGLTHPLNILFLGLPNKLNLLEASKLGAKRAKMVSDVIIETFN